MGPFKNLKALAQSARRKREASGRLERQTREEPNFHGEIPDAQLQVPEDAPEVKVVGSAAKVAEIDKDQENVEEDDNSAESDNEGESEPEWCDYEWEKSDDEEDDQEDGESEERWHDCDNCACDECETAHLLEENEETVPSEEESEPLKKRKYVFLICLSPRS